MTDQSTNFIASNGEHRNPFYQGTFEDETTEQMERRLHWATAAVEAERVVQNNKTAPQPTPDVSALVAIAREVAQIKAAQPTTPMTEVAKLVEALESLIKGYVNLLEAGMDRITSLGGDCDPIHVMEQNDPWLRDARTALAAHRKGGEL